MAGGRVTIRDGLRRGNVDRVPSRSRVYGLHGHGRLHGDGPLLFTVRYDDQSFPAGAWFRSARSGLL